MEFRECGECDLCCRWLSHDVYGQEITLDSPCRFIKNGCSIHKNRPAHCKRYECMWSQGVLPEWMFPKDIRIIVSVKNWPHGRGKWLELIDPENKMTDKIFEELQKLEVPIKKVAIEVNQMVINKKSLSRIKIKKNDKIEIVHFIGGG